jgi:hypothetical protein
LADTVISLAILEKDALRFSSWRPLRCWMLAHFECPAMLTSLIADVAAGCCRGNKTACKWLIIKPAF